MWNGSGQEGGKKGKTEKTERKTGTEIDWKKGSKWSAFKIEIKKLGTVTLVLKKIL